MERGRFGAAVLVVMMAVALVVTMMVRLHRTDLGRDEASICDAGEVIVGPVGMGTPLPEWPVASSVVGCVRIIPGGGVETPGGQVLTIIIVDSGTLTGRFARPVVVGHTGLTRNSRGDSTRSRTVAANEDVELQPGDSIQGPFGVEGTVRNMGTTDAVLAVFGSGLGPGF